MSFGRLMVIGLDCADPRIVLGTHSEHMPSIRALARRGAWGRLRSTRPPITVPAWVTMTTGRDPGELGLYGFHNREPGSYEQKLASSQSVRYPRIWDVAADHGLRSIVIGVPLTYPPPERFFGSLVTGPLTPGPDSVHTTPRSLAAQLESRFGPFIPDVEGFRDEDRTGLLDRIAAATNQRFDIAEHLVLGERWDLFMMVDMGLDRFQHAFLRYLTPGHPAWRGQEPDEAGLVASIAYLRMLDERVGRLAALADEETTIMVVSDHGVRPLMGGFAINEWLILNGYLTLAGEAGARRAPARPAGARRRLEPADIDWTRTHAWADGGYVARIHLNVKGREPEGVLEPGRRDAIIEEMIAGLEMISLPDGSPMHNVAFRPEHQYARLNGQAPDLVVELGALAYRAVGTVGHRALFLPGNDTGPDDANHDRYGLAVVAGPDAEPGTDLGEIGIDEVLWSHFEHMYESQ